MNSRRSDSMRPAGTSTLRRPDRLLDVLHREAARRQLGGREPDPHREAALAEDPRLAHAGQRLQPALHQPVADVGELEQVVVLAREREPEERLRVGVLLGHDRLLHVLRQPPADPGHLVADVLGGGLDVAVEVELEGDVAELLAARAGQGASPSTVLSSSSRMSVTADSTTWGWRPGARC